MKLRSLAHDLWEIVAVCSERGVCPTTDFLEAQQGNIAKHALRAWALLRSVSRRGPRIGGELSKELGDGLLEFRPGVLRILWFYDAGRVVVCSHGFVKRSRKTPKGEIDRAREARRRYFEAKSRGALEIEEGGK